MPDHQEAIDIATALHALGDLLDDDAPLRAEVRLGLAVMLKHLAERLGALGCSLCDQHYKIAS